MSIKTLPKCRDARANLCSLKKKIGEPPGTNISTIIIHRVRFGLVRLVYLFTPHIVIFLHEFFKALLLYYWNADFC